MGLKPNEMTGFVIFVCITLILMGLTSMISTSGGVKTGFELGYKEGRLRGMNIGINNYMGISSPIIKEIGGEVNAKNTTERNSTESEAHNIWATEPDKIFGGQSSLPG